MSHKIFYPLLLLLAIGVQSCGGGSKTAALSEEESKLQMLKAFYTAYITEVSKLPENDTAIDSIKSKYFTAELRQRLAAMDLDYDPILNAQDCEERWIATLNVYRDTNRENTYNVCYTYDGGTTCIALLLIKGKNGEYLIGDILMDMDGNNPTEMVCEHTTLSDEFDVKTLFERYALNNDASDSCAVKLLLTDKVTKELLDSLTVVSGFYLSNVFMDCDNVRSYSTKLNADKEVMDNDYGDVVVADLNFDGKDDIAVVNDSGGNGGPFYNYYLQTADRKFMLDKFLTDSMVFFPSKIVSKDNTLVTHVHAGVCYLGEHVYQLDKRTNRWTEKSHRTINICND